MPKFYQQSLEVINVPVKMRKQIEKFNKLKEIKDKQKALQSIRGGDKSFPIITCKNTRHNFYYGQTYGKFDKVHLASQVWESRRVKDDSFIIHKYSENPAFDDRYCSPNFENLGLNEKVVNQLKKCGYETPTNIQTLAIPEVLKRINTIISAETGNGKTIAFLAPIVHQILEKMNNPLHEPPLNAPQALILLPSRELVTQTRDVARALCTDLGIRVNSIYGGRTKRIMLDPRVAVDDILIGSFGAISKLFTNRVYRKQRLIHIVLDEADTLLDDSFNDKMTYFLQKCPIGGTVSDIRELSQKPGEEEEEKDPVGAQLTLVGATFPRSLHTILQDFINVESLKQIQTPYLHRISPHITHTFLKLGGSQRVEAVMKIAKKNDRARIPTIIFCNTSSSSNFVSNLLNENDIRCINVNAQMGAMERIGRFEQFQKGEINFIACTDLVSRGLDTVRARHVVNFDFPQFISDYIHRCGRTGRVGSEGNCQVTNFVFSQTDAKLVQKIEYAARRTENLPNVNANIKRALVGRAEKKKRIEYAEKEAKADAEEMEMEIKRYMGDKPPLDKN